MVKGGVTARCDNYNSHPRQPQLLGDGADPSIAASGLFDRRAKVPQRL